MQVFSWRVTQANSCVVSVFWLQTGFPVSPALRLVHVMENTRSVFAEKKDCHSNRSCSGHCQPPPEPSPPLGDPASSHKSAKHTLRTATSPHLLMPSHPARMLSLFPILSHSHQFLSGVTHPSSKNPPRPPVSGLADRMNE